MTEPKRRLAERILEPTYTEGLSEKSLDDLRAMRDECREVENELSFERRLCQARIDILAAELRGREGAGADDLVSQLPEILAAEQPPQSDTPLPERAPNFAVPRSADIPRRRIDEIVGERTLAQLPNLSTEEVRSIMDSLNEYEPSISRRRKSVQEVMDRIQAEIVRRYVSGQADPSAALS
jgi:hypothetical protein